MITDSRKVSEDFNVDGIDKSYDEMFGLLCANSRVTIGEGRFIYFIDSDYVLDTTHGFRHENITPAYDMAILNGLIQMKYPAIENDFMKSYNLVLDNLCVLADRIIAEIKKKDVNDHRAEWFEDLKMQPAKHFEEAVQRMLFINQIFWQTDHRLVGLGAWDSFLWPYYENDCKEGYLNKEHALAILEDLFKTLHENYTFKSNVLMGDTGQIFVIGRSTIEGDYVCNELTYLFIEAMKNVQLPEPKCLLRVNKNTPRDLLEISLASIVTGIGAPLLANDDVIIPCLTEFGIKPDDACEYATSACWEPLIGGKSSTNNNRTVLNYLKAMDNLFKRENLEAIETFDEFMEKYLVYLRRNLRAIKRVLSNQRFQYNPLLSVFLYGCKENRKDVSEGGALYHNVGMTSVAMGNTIDSLLNIRKLVFEEKKYTLCDVKKMLILDYEGFEKERDILKEKYSNYGKDNETVIYMVKQIMDCVSEEIKDFLTPADEKLKVGLSGAAYLDAAKGFGASFDGRKFGEPFTVHISNEDNESFTEIVRFVSQLSFSDHQFNGNVIDYMVSPGFINNNWDKYIDFLQGCIRAGFFEMQMNVVSSKTLIEARKNPEQFPNLIVRVWGFSSYFKDLPDDYKEVLIRRALENERRAS